MNMSVRLPLVAAFIFICLFGPTLQSIRGQEAVATSTATTTPASQSSPAAAQAPPSSVISIPGPLRSFLRMSAISQKVSPDEIAPLMARNIFLLGYEGPQSQARETEYLVLLNRYVQQARELVNSRRRDRNRPRLELRRRQAAPANSRLSRASRLRPKIHLRRDRRSATRLPDHRFRLPAARSRKSFAGREALRLLGPDFARSRDFHRSRLGRSIPPQQAR